MYQDSGPQIDLPLKNTTRAEVRAYNLLRLGSVAQPGVLWGLEHGRRTGPRLGTAVVLRVACARLAKDWATAYARVIAALGRVVRASSAVVCVNSVLRMQQARHRTLSQEMLGLERLYWNCRAFRSGKPPGKCPYQLLGASWPTYDSCSAAIPTNRGKNCQAGRPKKRKRR